MDTPFSQITLALDGKIDFIKKTNPWGSGEDEGQKAAENLPRNPKFAMNQLRAILERRAKTQGRLPGNRVAKPGPR
ncbi:MAG: hypothetical protein AB7F35_06370 [Acetobacteraceae bacterium]